MHRERLINRRRQGDLGEASAIEWLTRMGANVLLPLGQSPDYDLVADLGGHLLRIQVKTTLQRRATKDGSERWEVLICTNGGNRSGTGVTKLFDPAAVDALFVLAGNGRRWLIPAGRVGGRRALKLGGAKYSEFEIQPSEPIWPLVYGCLEREPRMERRTRGSFGVGEPSGPVKSVPLAEWVRIPPPPSNPHAGRAEDRAGGARGDG